MTNESNAEQEIVNILAYVEWSQHHINTHNKKCLSD
jgi:hypothetical protein